MKQTIALLFGICMTIFTLYLIVTKRIDLKMSVLLFLFALIGGLGISNYDIIKKIKWEGWRGLELEIYERKVHDIKDDALKEIEQEVSNHKQSIAMLIRTGNELSDRLESQKLIVNTMIEKAQSLETQLQEDQKKLEDIRGQVVLAHRNSQAIFNATKELSIILTRITYVQAQTKGEFGSSPRLKEAAEIIENDINRVLQLMIPDPNERSAFVQELTNALPSR